MQRNWIKTKRKTENEKKEQKKEYLKEKPHRLDF